jgi:pilus assembly protein CpaB
MSRMSPGTLLLAVVAIAAGLLGAYIVKQNLEKQDQVAEVVAEEPKAETTVVPVSSTSLKAGREITLGDIALYRLSRSELAERGIKGPFMNNTEQIIGRVLRGDLPAGQVFDTNAFYPEGMGPGVVELLEPGKRAITVPVEMDSAVAGFATPGTWVDVLFRSNASNSRASQDDALPEVAVTLLERVKVLAVNDNTFEGRRSAGQGATQSSRVTLEVNPDDATALRVVDGRGTLALALRHPDDELSFSRQNPLSLTELLNIPPPQKHQMEIFRGNRVSRVDFETQRDSTQFVTRVAEQEDPPVTPEPNVTPTSAKTRSSVRGN